MSTAALWEGPLFTYSLGIPLWCIIFAQTARVYSTDNIWSKRTKPEQLTGVKNSRAVRKKGSFI